MCSGIGVIVYEKDNELKGLCNGITSHDALCKLDTELKYGKIEPYRFELLYPNNLVYDRGHNKPLGNGLFKEQPEQKIWDKAYEVSNPYRMKHTIKQLQYATLFGIDLSGVTFEGLNFEGANFSEANLYETNFSEANLSGVNFSRANLSRTIFIKANLEGVNFYKANLSEANLYETNLSGANFSEADLSGANLSRAYYLKANPEGANFYKTNFSGIILKSI